MKRLMCLILSLLLFAFSGCQRQDDPSVCFYYLRSEYVYGVEDGVIASETRDIAMQDIGYLLELYLKGPQNETLVSPFPRNTRLISTHMQEGVLSLELSEEFTTLEDMDLTLAAGCIASTCFSLTDAQSVRITAVSSRDEISIVLSRDSLTLVDDSMVSTEAAHPTAQ